MHSSNVYRGFIPTNNGDDLVEIEIKGSSTVDYYAKSCYTWDFDIKTTHVEKYQWSGHCDVNQCKHVLEDDHQMISIIRQRGKMTEHRCDLI